MERTRSATRKRNSNQTGAAIAQFQLPCKKKQRNQPNTRVHSAAAAAAAAAGGTANKDDKLGRLELFVSGSGADPFFKILHEHLSVTEFAALCSTCNTLKNFIQYNKRLEHSSKRTRTVSASTLLKLAQCTWIRPYFIELYVNMRPAAAAVKNTDKATKLATEPPSFVPLMEVVAALICFPRLCRLGLQLGKFDANREDWKAAFAGKGFSNMRAVHVMVALTNTDTPPPMAVPLAVAPGAAMAIGPATAAAAAAAVPAAVAVAVPAAAAAAAIGNDGVDEVIAPPLTAAASMMLEIGQLRRLEALTISNVHEPVASLSFTALPTLPVLAHVIITLAPHPRAPKGSASASLFHCTREQTACLARCAMLSSIRCGAWSKPWFESEASRAADPRVARMVHSGIAVLAAGQNTMLRDSERQLSQARASRTSSVQSEPQLTACPLQALHLDGTLMTVDVWKHVSTLPSLTALLPLAWYADVDTEAFQKLRLFKQLRSFALSTIPEEDEPGVAALGPITAERFLPSLLHCTLLQSLHLSNINLDTQQLTDICTRFPQLKHISLRTLRLESVEPLAFAKNLYQLSLHFCTQVPLPSSSNASVYVASAAPGAGDEDAPPVGTAPTLVRMSASDNNHHVANEAHAAAPLLNVGGDLCFRRTLPALLSLRQLLLYERVRITARAAAPLNAELYRRMPLLNPKHFHQNPLAELSDISAPVVVNESLSASM